MSVNDFNLAFCGLATAAVGLGYVCGRRLSGSRSPLPTDLHAKKNPKDLEAGLPANEPSVGQKRKRMDHDFDEVKSLERWRDEDSVADARIAKNLKQIYPHKRMRTPTPPPDPALLPQHAPEPEASVEPAPQVLVEAHPVQQETAIIVDVQTSVHANAGEPESTSSATSLDTVQVNAAEVAALDEKPVPRVDAPASPKPAAAEDFDQQKQTSQEAATAAAEQAQPTDVAIKPTTVEACPSTPPSEPATAIPAPSPKLSPAFELKSPSTRPKTPETPKPTSTRGRGFAAFAGSASPFAKLATPKAGSSTAPAWASPNAADSNGPPAWVDPTSSAWAERKTGSPVAKEAVALEPQLFAAPAAHSWLLKDSTGEEDEDATVEIRAIRLYTKRGSKGFSEGIVGTMKVLRHKETQKQRLRRMLKRVLVSLVFRRDPLFQVAMNVRVQEGMRCTYDAKDRVVRIVTREPSSEGTPEIVIYAMKPSRSCPKTKFEEFGEAMTTLVGSLSTA
ncbi:hypothetical protein EV121DRAFT_268853 [Schizophyllum commune]